MKKENNNLARIDNRLTFLEPYLKTRFYVPKEKGMYTQVAKAQPNDHAHIVVRNLTPAYYTKFDWPNRPAKSNLYIKYSFIGKRVDDKDCIRLHLADDLYKKTWDNTALILVEVKQSDTQSIMYYLNAYKLIQLLDRFNEEGHIPCKGNLSVLSPVDPFPTICRAHLQMWFPLATLSKEFNIVEAIDEVDFAKATVKPIYATFAPMHLLKGMKESKFITHWKVKAPMTWDGFHLGSRSDQSKPVVVTRLNNGVSLEFPSIKSAWAAICDAYQLEINYTSFVKCAKGRIKSIKLKDKFDRITIAYVEPQDKDALRSKRQKKEPVEINQQAQAI